MHSAVNVVGLCGVLVFVRDLARGACRKLSSGKWPKHIKYSKGAVNKSLVEAIARLYDVADQLRDRVNYRRRHAALIRNAAAWNTTCSAMDVVGDTCQALRAYSEHAALPDNDKGAAYLLAYGVLHALYLQQDAVFWWCKYLNINPAATFDEPGPWARSIPELDKARNVRNDSTGHPVRRDRPKKSPVAAFFIVQHSLSSHGFQLIKHQEDRVHSEWSDVSFPDLIADQVRGLTAVLEAACQSLDAEDAKHHQQFMQKPLTPILHRLSYPIGKLGSKEYLTDWQLMPAHVDQVQKGLAELKQAILERSEPFDEPWKWSYRKLECALGRLREYGSVPSSPRTEDDLAAVLSDYVRCAIDELKEMTEELDDQYFGKEE